jgi:hypothetical protein
MPQGKDGEKTGTVSADSEGGIYICCDISDLSAQQIPPTTQTTETQAQKTE